MFVQAFDGLKPVQFLEGFLELLGITPLYSGVPRYLLKTWVIAS